VTRTIGTNDYELSVRDESRSEGSEEDGVRTLSFEMGTSWVC
jgi:hypothetical protein